MVLDMVCDCDDSVVVTQADVHAEDEDAASHLSLQQQMTVAIKRSMMCRQHVKPNADDVGKSLETFSGLRFCT